MSKNLLQYRKLKIMLNNALRKDELNAAKKG